MKKHNQVHADLFVSVYNRYGGRLGQKISHKTRRLWHKLAEPLYFQIEKSLTSFMRRNKLKQNGGA